MASPTLLILSASSFSIDKFKVSSTSAINSTLSRESNPREENLSEISIF
jgi:hypothetical protein